MSYPSIYLYERIFEVIEFVISNICKGEDVFSITCDGLGSFTKQENTVR